MRKYIGFFGEGKITCDGCGCGCSTPVFDTIIKAIKFAEKDGWAKDYIDGQWIYYCPECIWRGIK